MVSNLHLIAILILLLLLVVVVLFVDLDVGQMANSTVWERVQGDHPLQTSWAFWYDRKQNKKLTGARYNFFPSSFF